MKHTNIYINNGILIAITAITMRYLILGVNDKKQINTAANLTSLYYSLFGKVMEMLICGFLYFAIGENLKRIIKHSNKNDTEH